ncbi:MAG: phosphate/phosphite/phosphonate ABC transporter substrate-binding protein [Bauldia sp.]|nr:phosphate/phosphite/phosphonate ABC transporter substrate-binding protein [Bauldia sp.]
MRLTNVPIAALALAAALLSSEAIAQEEADWREEVPVLRIGIVTGPAPNTDFALGQAEPFRAALEARLGSSVALVPATDYARLMEAQLTGVPVAFLSATAFAQLFDLCSCVEPLAVPRNADNSLGYRSVLLVPAGSPIGTVAALRGMRLAVSAADSIAGRLLPLALFVEEGLTVDALGALVERASPAAAVEAMLAGEADAALAWSSLTGSMSAGYSRGVMAQMVADGRLSMDDVRVAWRSPVIPNGPVAIRADAPDDLKADFLAALIDLAASEPEIVALVDGSFAGGYVPAEPALYDPLILMIENLPLLEPPTPEAPADDAADPA